MNPAVYKWTGSGDFLTGTKNIVSTKTLPKDPITGAPIPTSWPLINQIPKGSARLVVIIAQSSSALSAALVFTVSGLDLFGQVQYEDISISTDDAPIEGNISKASQKYYSFVSSITNVNVGGDSPLAIGAAAYSSSGFFTPFLTNVFSKESLLSFSVTGFIAGTVDPKNVLSLIPSYCLNRIPNWPSRVGAQPQYPFFDSSGIQGIAQFPDFIPFTDKDPLLSPTATVAIPIIANKAIAFVNFPVTALLFYVAPAPKAVPPALQAKISPFTLTILQQGATL